MAQLFGDENYIQNSIVTSRIIQENSAVLQGTSAYGSLAILLDANMEKIDNFAEYIGMCVAQNSNLKKYKQQYGTNILGGFSNRNLGDPNRAEDYQVSRRNIAFMENMLIEAGIKISARAVMKWADEKDKLQLFELIYSILYCYAYDDIENGNKRRTLVELKKIRESFPLSAKNKGKLAQIKMTDDILNIDFETLSKKNNTKIMEAVSYLLYSLHAQKFGGREDADRELLDYYNMMGYSGMLANEIMRENANKYNEIAYDQTRYLKIARGMIQNFDTCALRIDLNALSERAVQMSQFDPYYLPNMRSNKNSPTRKKKRISDIFFENPEAVMHAGITAISQLTLDPDSKENIRKKMVEWGIDGNTTDIIVNQSDIVKENAMEWD